MNFTPTEILDACTITDEAIKGGRRLTVKSQHGDVIEYTSHLNATHHQTMSISVNGYVYYSETDYGKANRDIVEFRKAVQAVYAQMHENEEAEREVAKTESLNRARTVFGEEGGQRVA